MAAAVTARDLHECGERGIENLFGRNNCFLNCIGQAFWHHDRFRAALIDLASAGLRPAEADGGEDARRLRLLLELCELMKRYSTEDGVVDPEHLRGALALVIKGYRGGTLHDAHELFAHLLAEVSAAMLPLERGGPTPESCYGLTLRKRADCGRCGSVAHESEGSSFFLSLWAGELAATAGPDAFARCLVSTDAARSCPDDACGGSAPTSTTLAGPPPHCIAVHCVWASGRMKRSDITDLLCSLPGRFSLATAVGGDSVGSTVCVLTGVVFFWGRHYISAFLNLKKGVWVIFDDASVKAAAKTTPGLWRYAVDACLVPCMIFYTTGEPEDASVLQASEFHSRRGAAHDSVQEEPFMTVAGEHNRAGIRSWLLSSTRKDMTSSELAAHRDVDVESLRNNPDAIEKLFAEADAADRRSTSPRRVRSPYARDQAQRDTSPAANTGRSPAKRGSSPSPRSGGQARSGVPAAPSSRQVWDVPPPVRPQAAAERRASPKQPRALPESVPPSPSPSPSPPRKRPRRDAALVRGGSIVVVSEVAPADVAPAAAAPERPRRPSPLLAGVARRRRHPPADLSLPMKPRADQAAAANRADGGNDEGLRRRSDSAALELSILVRLVCSPAA
eukprot:TRINITY_DN4668_c0_g1_i1.p1 TRINITY_DN4668_c0_g1~~TRINITY_DN4668_c0_g1_i1.p1  ORF type:complete len:640 (+),score=167.28 TRINITY_DN4668_c0_g1_i1:66-1922(+)